MVHLASRTGAPRREGAARRLDDVRLDHAHYRKAHFEKRAAGAAVETFLPQPCSYPHHRFLHDPRAVRAQREAEVMARPNPRVRRHAG